eukprot:Pgem_evm1s5823
MIFNIIFIIFTYCAFQEVVLYGNAEISCSPSTTYANGQSLSVGVEVGGRDTLGKNHENTLFGSNFN